MEQSHKTTKLEQILAESFMKFGVDEDKAAAIANRLSQQQRIRAVTENSGYLEQRPEYGTKLNSQPAS